MMVGRIPGVIFFAGFTLAAVRAQDLTLDQILKKNEDALGGAEAISRVQTLKFTARIIGPSGQAEVPMITWNKRPNLVRTESGIQGKRIIAGYDGTTGWMIDPLSGSSAPQKIDADTTANLADASIETAIGSLASLKAAGHTVELLGKEELGGTPVYRIQVTRKSGMTAWYLVDAATFLPLKTITKVTQPGQQIEVEAFLSNYRKAGDIMFAYAIEQRTGGRTVGQIIYEKIEINVSMDDSIFKMPGTDLPVVKRPADSCASLKISLARFSQQVSWRSAEEHGYQVPVYMNVAAYFSDTDEHRQTWLGLAGFCGPKGGAAVRLFLPEPMNERERFLRLFRGDPVDRPPLLEEGVRDEVLDRWRSEGMPTDKTHVEFFGLTPHENIGPDITYRPDYCGRLMNVSARDYRRAFQVSRRRFPNDWRRIVKRLENRDHIVCIWAYRGFFQALGVEDWPTLQPVLRALIRNPASVRDRLEMYGDFCARMVEMALHDVNPEFIYMSEPISDNKGPLISPDMFDSFAIPAYRRIIGLATAHGCKNILVSTYGNTSRLFPSMIQAGVNMLWISEAAEVPSLEYRTLRREFGPRLGLIGGIPLSILRSESQERIREQLPEIIVPLMRAGRYIPLAGGRIREDIPWETYKCYRESLSQIYNAMPG